MSRKRTAPTLCGAPKDVEVCPKPEKEYSPGKSIGIEDISHEVCKEEVRGTQIVWYLSVYQNVRVRDRARNRVGDYFTLLWGYEIRDKVELH